MTVVKVEYYYYVESLRIIELCARLKRLLTNYSFTNHIYLIYVYIEGLTLNDLSSSSSS